MYAGPHQAMSDIWVRYNHIDNWDPAKGLHAFNAPHESVWYPVADDIPELKEIVAEVLAQAGGGELGGVLITRIPPGGGVAPHRDSGWHAEYYFDKYAVQLKGDQDQGFFFETGEVRAEPGEVYWFNNLEEHWVENNSDSERMTLIICIRPTEG